MHHPTFPFHMSTTLSFKCLQGAEEMMEEEILRKPDLAHDKLHARMRKVPDIFSPPSLLREFGPPPPHAPFSLLLGGHASVLAIYKLMSCSHLFDCGPAYKPLVDTTINSPPCLFRTQMDGRIRYKKGIRSDILTRSWAPTHWC